MLKTSGDLGILWLTSVIKQVWQTGVIPPDWKNGIILPIYKGEGSPKEDCKNYKGISLLSIPGKVFATVLLNKVRDQLLAHRRIEQSGFTPGRSTIYQIFTLNTIIRRHLSVAASRAWNSLPADVRAAPSLLCFRRRLKTLLFRSHRQ